jgi:hypothetical protein
MSSVEEIQGFCARKDLRLSILEPLPAMKSSVPAIVPRGTRLHALLPSRREAVSEVT